MRRILALVLSVVMVLMLPVFAFAENGIIGYDASGNAIYGEVSDASNTSSTVTDSNGTTTETTTKADGTTVTVVTTADGEKTIDVELSEAAVEKEGAAVTPEVTAAEDVDAATKITVEVPAAEESALVEIPVTNKSTRAVVMKQDADGNWSVVKKTAVGEQGVVFEAEGTATYAVVENDIEFTDVTSSWEKEAAEFVSSRELMLGTGVDTFNPTKEVSADMMMTVLARLDGVKTENTVGADWAAAGESWAAAEGYAVSGTFTRGDMVKLLYKYAGKPEVKNADLSAFSDAEGLDEETAAAFAWCVENGIINGSYGKLSAEGAATRVQLAAVVMRFVNTYVNTIVQ